MVSAAFCRRPAEYRDISNFNIFQNRFQYFFIKICIILLGHPSFFAKNVIKWKHPKIYSEKETPCQTLPFPSPKKV